MARKPKNTLSFAPFSEVVSVTLWETFEDDMETYLASEADIAHEFYGLAAQGYSVTVEPDVDGGYVSKVRDLDKHRPSAGQMFFSHADTQIECMAIAVVKEHFLGRGQDWTTKVNSTMKRKWR